MNQLFNYNTLQVTLNRETKTLEVGLPETFSSELVFELEGLLGWTTDKIEISSILFRPAKEFFPSYFEESDLQSLTPGKFQKIIRKLRSLTYTMQYLPQTIIMDINTGCYGLGAEFALGGDIRIGLFRGHIHWNHLSLGISPMCGGIGLLEKLVGTSRAKSWILMGKKVGSSEALEAGLLTLTYQVNSEIKFLLRNINSQSQVSRIQAKRAFLETHRAKLDHCQDIDQKISEACLATGDFLKWNQSGKEREEFLSPLKLGDVIKESVAN